MPFPPSNIEKELIIQLDHFLSTVDFVTLFESYDWNRDTFQNGFPDILRLEIQLMKSAKNNGISLKDVKDVTEWGGLSNRGAIKSKDIVLPSKSLFTINGDVRQELDQQPTLPIHSLQEYIEKGIGPTYQSKIVRFGLPQEYGAIDTRCVRVFGQGDPQSQRHNWLPLKVRYGNRWYIPKTQAAWPDGYGRWINILRYFSQKLPKTCPHPKTFEDSGLRADNKWICSDVEMALFTYASKVINNP